MQRVVIISCVFQVLLEGMNNRNMNNDLLGVWFLIIDFSCTATDMGISWGVQLIQALIQQRYVLLHNVPYSPFTLIIIVKSFVPWQSYLRSWLQSCVRVDIHTLFCWFSLWPESPLFLTCDLDQDGNAPRLMIGLCFNWSCWKYF